jgi:hypothetical protein
MINAKKISLIKHNSSTFSISGGHLNRTYVIGFNDRKVANYVRDQITSKPICDLHPGKIFDVTGDVNKGLESMGVSDQVININIDTEAKLFIHKKPKNYTGLDQLYVEDCDFGDFLLLPIHKSIGVIMPEFIIDEDETVMQFKCHVIDPCEDMRLIRDNFQKLFNRE